MRFITALFALLLLLPPAQAQITLLGKTPSDTILTNSPYNWFGQNNNADKIIDGLSIWGSANKGFDADLFSNLSFAPGTATTNGGKIHVTPSGGGGGSGDVVGPASSVASRIALFDGTTGKLLKQSSLLDTDLQPVDADLTTIAALSPSNDDVIQRKAGSWVSRTPAQLKADLALVKGDVGLGNVDNTSDANKPVSTATQTALDLKAPKNPTLNPQTGTTYTLVLTDDSKVVTLSNGSATTLTVPLNSSVPFPVGAQITIIQLGTGQVTISPTGGVTINAAGGANKLRVQYSSATLIKRDVNTWVLIGDIST